MHCDLQLTFTSLLFLGLISETDLHSIVSTGCLTKATELQGITRPCSDIINFNYLWAISSTSGCTNNCNYTVCVFPTTSWLPTPTKCPYVITSDTGEKSYLEWRPVQLASHSIYRTPIKLRTLHCIIMMENCVDNRQYTISRYTMLNFIISK